MIVHGCIARWFPTTKGVGAWVKSVWWPVIDWRWAKEKERASRHGRLRCLRPENLGASDAVTRLRSSVCRRSTDQQTFPSSHRGWRYLLCRAQTTLSLEIVTRIIRGDPAWKKDWSFWNIRTRKLVEIKMRFEFAVRIWVCKVSFCELW